MSWTFPPPACVAASCGSAGVLPAYRADFQRPTVVGCRPAGRCGILRAVPPGDGRLFCETSACLPGEPVVVLQVAPEACWSLKTQQFGAAPDVSASRCSHVGFVRRPRIRKESGATETSSAILRSRRPRAAGLWMEPTFER